MKTILINKNIMCRRLKVVHHKQKKGSIKNENSD